MTSSEKSKLADQATVQPAPSAAAVEREMAIAFRPVVRGFLFALWLYYGLLTLSYIVIPQDFPVATYAVLFALISGSAIAAGVMHRLARSACRKRTIEFYGLAANAILLGNITVQMALSFEAENLAYFILAMPIFATTCISLRTTLPSIAITIAALLSFVAIHMPEILGEYLFMALAASISAAGMAMLMRGAVFRATTARLEADENRRRAELLAAKSEMLAEKAEALTAQTREMAERDSLTGLVNRFSFFNAFGTAIASRRQPGQAPMLVLIDLDGFKPVNDTYGHSVGDELLGEVARRLSAAAPRQAIVARLGGDEFAILLPHDRIRTSLEEFGRSICAELGQPYVLDSIHAHISASAGLVVCDREDLSIRQWMERGDFAMYHAKRNTRGEAVLFNNRHEAEMQGFGRIDQAMRDGNLNDELSIVFQPQHDLDSGRTYGFEALARWDSPALGAVNPDSFIKVAEASGLIRKVTPVLLAKTLDAVQDWPEHIQVSFNLSGHDLMSPVAVSEILDLVKQSGIAPERIEFEITETAMMADIDQARRSIERMAALGCRLALDDFGAGYSSFSYLHQLPVSKIKIDRSFVVPLLKDPSAGKIIQTIINLGRSLNLDCVVEGVESIVELDRLKTMGARFIQGYIFGQPMQAHSVRSYLAAEGRDTASAPPAEAVEVIEPDRAVAAKRVGRRR
ncbi:putative bifunctional diguanylate cyclase/phosphodiesterase [Maricaulis sp.]|uniref:putative bifunctional diguanylate cyclase/phosphodiesterase n=1 Tax=Maricaulis sp. TaxID=1486257 RepID=UPI003A934873